jgi:hypothetical protein
MLFPHKVTTIFITRGKIRSAVYSTRGKIIQEVKTYAWDDETLPSVLEDIATSGANKVRLVFGEEYAYVTTIKTSQAGRPDLLQKAREEIPEELGSNWDFKVGNNSDSAFQISAIDPDVFNLFEKKLKDAGFLIESAEPQSIAVSRLMPQNGKFLFMVRDEKVLIGAIRDGLVEFTYVTNSDETVAIFRKSLLLIEKKWQAKPEIVIVNDQIDPKAEIFSSSGLFVETKDLNPLYAAAIKKDISGEDSHVLNIKTE